ncbi:MAG: hypothetical protein ACI89U_002834 [Gammaproteobacteria bacterium]|jgi:hypothetical protein
MLFFRNHYQFFICGFVSNVYFLSILTLGHFWPICLIISQSVSGELYRVGDYFKRLLSCGFFEQYLKG